MADHAELTGTALHEPKGVATAAAGRVYVADGAGSGDWLFPGGAVYGEMKVTQNATPQTFTAAGDATLNTDSQYVKLDTGIWTTGEVQGVTFDSSGYLTITVSGLYEISFWSSFSVSVINTLTGIKFSSNDTNTTLTGRKLTRLSGAGGDVGSMSSSLFRNLVAGDKVSVWAATNKNADVTLVDAGLTLTLLKAA